jgi:hypothetical protein
VGRCLPGRATAPGRPEACMRVTSQDFIKFWGKFFAFILNVLIEKSQDF